MSDQKDVTIYSTPSCHFCNQAKEFFTDNDVKYTEYDVAADQEKAQEMVTRSGQMGVPVIFIGEDMVIGFDEGRIRALLGL